MSLRNSQPVRPMFSRACSYGIQASLYLAHESSSGEFVPAHRIAADLQVPFHFLKKILQRLTEKGITRSVRSTHGGVALGKDPGAIRVWDIVEAIDGIEQFASECILKLPSCNASKPCPLHHAWAAERVRLQSMLKSATLLNGADAVQNLISRAHDHAPLHSF